MTALSSLAPAPLQLGGRIFILGQKTLVMGVLNVTPDSFSDGGRYTGVEAAVARGLALAQAGADVIDVGGQSTRPGSDPVSVEEECLRVVPVIERLARKTDVPLSVDTYKSEVAEAALKAGALLVNDVSGFTADPRMAQVVAQAKAACCLMHMQGIPKTMQKAPAYADVVSEVKASLADRIALAEGAGVPRSKILVDPGIGFGKSLEHNLSLIRNLAHFRTLGCGVVLGTSRKAFLGTLMGGRPPEDRLSATLGSIAAAVTLGGVDVVRVHDVKEAKDALAVADALARSF